MLPADDPASPKLRGDAGDIDEQLDLVIRACLPLALTFDLRT
jgi:hypothetical protein